MKKILAAAAACMLTAVTLGAVASQGHSADINPVVNQSMMIVETTNSTGYIYALLPEDFDEVQVTAAQPQAGPHAIVSVTATRTPRTATEIAAGRGKVRFRVWSVGPGHTVIPDAGQEVILYITTAVHD